MEKIELLNNDDAYFAYKALSASQIKTFVVGGVYDFWKTSVFNPERKEGEETDALIFGKYAHCCLFEQEEVSKRFLVLDWGTKTRGTAKWKKAVEENPNKILISPDEAEKARKMVECLKNHKVASKVLENCKCEEPFIWTDKATGLPCKAKLDAYKENGDIMTIVDYKTSSDIDGVLNKAEKYQYPIQAVFYQRAIKEKYGKDSDFIFIVQSSKVGEEDKICVCYVEHESLKVAEQILENSMIKIKELLDEYEVFKDKTIFEPYPELMELKYSNWYLNGNM